MKIEVYIMDQTTEPYSIPPELRGELFRERALLVGMDAVSRGVSVPALVLEIISASDVYIEQMCKAAHIKTSEDLDRWSDSIKW